MLATGRRPVAQATAHDSLGFLLMSRGSEGEARTAEGAPESLEIADRHVGGTCLLVAVRMHGARSGALVH